MIASGTVCVVTGASGHIGVNLVAALRARDVRVRAVDTHSTESPCYALWAADPGVEHVCADVRDGGALVGAIAGADVVFHLAARVSVTGDPDGSLWTVNTDGVRNVAAAALECGVRRFVLCSSVHAYDLERAGEWLDESGPRSISSRLPVYDRSKWAGELALRGVIEEGLDAVIVNPTACVGPGDYRPSQLGQVLLDLYAGRLPAIVRGAFDWVDVRDVSATLISAADHGVTGGNYLAPGHQAGIRELAGLVEACGGRPAPRWVLPTRVTRTLLPLGRALPIGLDPAMFTRESLRAIVNNRRIDGSKAWRDLGHCPRPLPQTIRDTCRWFTEPGAVTDRSPDGRHGSAGAVAVRRRTRQGPAGR